MEEARLSGLTERQRECLRPLAEGLTVQQIAAELGISKDAINERLRSARRVTGATSSRALALALVRSENPDGYKAVVDRRFVVPTTADFGAGDVNPTAIETAGSTQQAVREGTTLFDFDATGDPSPPWRALLRGAIRNELTPRQTLLAIAVLVPITILATGAFLLIITGAAWVLLDSTRR